MSITRANLLTQAKAIAQDASTTPLLLSAGYDEAISMAIPAFDKDRPNERVILHTVSSSAFRFVLSGSGALAGLTGLNAWTARKSRMVAVWYPYDTTEQGRKPLEADEWRTLREPGLEVLEFQYESPGAGSVIRLDFVNPHVVDEASANATSVDSSDVDALAVLVASQILTMYAARAIQNTGNTGLQLDVVDRRNHANEARQVAKVLLERYGAMVGRATEEHVTPASAVVDMDVEMATPLGSMFSRRRF